MLINENNSTDVLQQWMTQCEPYQNHYDARGIVMVAGGDKYYLNAYCSIRLLRDKGCDLPIEVWRLNQKESRPIVEKELQKLGCEIIDASEFNKKLKQPHTHLNGWECKPFAIINSKFEDVLFLDTDVFVDGDPEFVFDTKTYKDVGAIYKPDYNRLQKWRTFWKVMGIPYRDEPEFESGIIYINKKKCWKALNLTNKICEYGTRFFFDHFFGDKEAFHAAHILTNTDYYMEPTPIKSLEGTMVQHHEGKPLYYHRNMEKLNLYTNKRIKGFKNEDKLFRYIDELKQLWHPKYPPGKGIEGRYDYIRVGLDFRQIEINGHLITKNEASREKYISLSTENNKTQLYIVGDDGKTTAVLEPWNEGYVGRWLEHEKCVVLLIKKGELNEED